MAYVTEDRRVQAVIARLKTNAISREQAAGEIKALPPQEGARIRYLDWEVDEALKSAKPA